MVLEHFPIYHVGMNYLDVIILITKMFNSLSHEQNVFECCVETQLNFDTRREC